MFRRDLVGKRFGRLTVLRFTSMRNCRSVWLTRCDCGEEKEILGVYLTHGRTKSCGCLKMELSRQINFKHGMSGTPEHRTWLAIRARCRGAQYKRYTGRGIKVCERWQTFENFLADIGPKPKPHEKYTIERIDNDGDYEPGNCRWATYQDQARNKRGNRMITHCGETLCLMEWAERTGLTRECIANRLNRGWLIKDALTTPNPAPHERNPETNKFMKSSRCRKRDVES